jgi:hypothetical protein
MCNAPFVTDVPRNTRVPSHARFTNVAVELEQGTDVWICAATLARIVSIYRFGIYRGVNPRAFAERMRWQRRNRRDSATLVQQRKTGSPSMPSTNGLERLGFMLAGVTAIVTLVAFLMVREHIEAREHLGTDRLASSVSPVSAASAATQ